MELILQKTGAQTLMCLDVQALESLPSPFTVTVKEKTMTDKQRGALHVWCEKVAICLNDNDLNYKYLHVITGVEIEKEWNKMLVKEYLYKPTLANLIGKGSTEKQNTVEPSVIAEAIARAFSIHKNITLPNWPSMRG